MKLYYHPVSTTCRPILQLAAEENIDLELKLVDLFTGEQMKPDYLSVNPSHQVPVLDDDDFRLTESSAILKYIADKAGSPTYPTERRARARVNERMDWFNTGLYRDLGYGFIYPQILPPYRRADEKVQAATCEWGREKAREWLKILDENLIGPDNAHLCGQHITIADFFGAALLTVGEVICLDYAAYPNIKRWLGNVKSRSSWAQANEGFYKYFVEPYKNGTYLAL